MNNISYTIEAAALHAIMEYYAEVMLHYKKGLKKWKPLEVIQSTYVVREVYEDVQRFEHLFFDRNDRDDRDKLEAMYDKDIASLILDKLEDYKDCNVFESTNGLIVIHMFKGAVE